MLKIIKALYLFLNAVVIIVLLTIHFVLKESTYQFSLLYYTFPLPVIIIILLLLIIFLNRKLRKYNFIIAALLLIIWLGRSFKIHISENIKESDLEIVFWNASHDRYFDDAFKENNGVPDVLVIVEHAESGNEEFKLKYPNYSFYRSIRGISLFSKSPLKIIEEKGSKYKTNIIKFKTKGLLFYVVDVSASMDVPRSWELEFVNETITQSNNTIVLGDFNVPYESKYLDDIKIDFNHAFSEKGNGFRETWFWNIPLLSLDHIWVSKDLEVIKSEKISTFKSDHSMIKTYVRK